MTDEIAATGCAACKGSGDNRGQRCTVCGGTGRAPGAAAQPNAATNTALPWGEWPNIAGANAATAERCERRECSKPLNGFYYALILVTDKGPEQPSSFCSTECVRSATRQIDAARTWIEGRQN